MQYAEYGVRLPARPGEGNATNLTIEQVLQYAIAAGFRDANLITAVAIAMAESGLNPAAVNVAGNTPPSRDRGLWQVNSYWHPEVTDACAFDPACAARAAFAISGQGGNFAPWTTFANGAYRANLAAVQAVMAGGTPPRQKGSGMHFWVIRAPWNSCVAIDEFGNGTLNGLDASGPSFDACGPAALENTAANYESRQPTYDNIGHIRADMIGNGEWSAGASIGNPRTSGCYIGNIQWEVPRRHYDVVDFHDYQGAVLTETDVLAALSHERAVIFIVTNAQALIGNEHGVEGHFVVVAGYGGDNADGTTGKLYVLNSDIAGQHGVATGQWTDMATLLAAEPHGWVVMAPPTPPPPPPPPPAPGPDVAGAISDLQDALKKLGA